MPPGRGERGRPDVTRGAVPELIVLACPDVHGAAAGGGLRLHVAVLQRRHFADPRQGVAHEADDGPVAEPLQAAAVFCTRGSFLGLLPANADDLAAAPCASLAADPAQQVTAAAVGDGTGETGDLVHPGDGGAGNANRRRRGAGRVTRLRGGGVPPNLVKPRAAVRRGECATVLNDKVLIDAGGSSSIRGVSE